MFATSLVNTPTISTLRGEGAAERKSQMGFCLDLSGEQATDDKSQPGGADLNVTRLWLVRILVRCSHSRVPCEYCCHCWLVTSWQFLNHSSSMTSNGEWFTLPCRACHRTWQVRNHAMVVLGTAHPGKLGAEWRGEANHSWVSASSWFRMTKDD